MNKSLKLIFSTYIYIVLVTTLVTLPHNIFRDRLNYMTYVTNWGTILENYKDSGLNLFTNEPLFLFLNAVLGSIFNSSTVVSIFVFIIFSAYFLLLYKYSKNMLMLLLGLICLFVIPYCFHFQFVILRQSLSTVILLSSIYYLNDYKKVLIISLILSFVHVSFFLITFILFINYLLKNKSLKSKVFYLIFISICIASIIEIIARHSGARQAEALLNNTDKVNGGAFVLWLIVTIYIIIKVNKNHKILYDFCLSGLILFLALYFVSPISGRLMCSFVPAVILLVINKSCVSNFYILLAIIGAYTIIISNGAITDASLLVSGNEFFTSFKETLFLRGF